MLSGTIYSGDFDKVTAFNEQVCKIVCGTRDNPATFSEQVTSLLKEVKESKFEIIQKRVDNARKSSDFNGELRSACGHLEELIIQEEKSRENWVRGALFFLVQFALFTDLGAGTSRLLYKTSVLLALFRQRIGDSILKEETLEQAAKYLDEIDSNFWHANSTRYMLARSGKAPDYISFEAVTKKREELINSFNALAKGLQSSRRVELEDRKGALSMY